MNDARHQFTTQAKTVEVWTVCNDCDGVGEWESYTPHYAMSGPYIGGTTVCEACDGQGGYFVEEDE